MVKKEGRKGNDRLMSYVLCEGSRFCLTYIFFIVFIKTSLIHI